MPLPRLLPKVIVAAGVLALIAGCASGAAQSDQALSGSQSGAQSSAATETGPSVNRDPEGGVPVVSFADDGTPSMVPLDEDPPKEITVKTLTEGDGAEVRSDDIVTVNYSGFLWDAQRPFENTFGAAPATFSLNEVLTGWKWALTGTKVGDTVEVVIPPDYGYGSTRNGRVPPDSTLVFVIEVLEVVAVDPEILTEATDLDADLPPGLTINGDLGEEPIIEFAQSAKPPKSLVTVPLSAGTGPVVTDTDSVLYHATMAPWGSTGSQQSTWNTALQQVPQAVPSMLGQRVGSRVLVVEPSAQEGTPAAVFIIDIVGAYPNRQVEQEEERDS